MGEITSIEWCDRTFNPWVGCTKVSDGCKNCYAEALMDKRYGKVKWGPQGTRVRTSPAYWKQPLKWNREEWVECVDCGFRRPYHETHDFCSRCEGEDLRPTRQRVFCASLADVFEDRPELKEWRLDLWALVTDTPNLDWLLLTKRPENVNLFWPSALQSNIWIGTSVEDQKTADARIPMLERIAATVRFLSVEPLLGPVDLYKHIEYRDLREEPYVHWLIAGGESGRNARPMHPDWARSLRDQCQAANVPFLFKQWGEFVPYIPREGNPKGLRVEHVMANGSRYYPGNFSSGLQSMIRVGKKAAGRLLDGREWNEFPVSKERVE